MQLTCESALMALSPCLPSGGEPCCPFVSDVANTLKRRGTGHMCLLLQDYDDDGESAAGGRLLRLLTLVGAENVLVVVSRWYGGVLLGPARFTHINNAARQLLDECGYVSTKQTKPSKKK